MKDSAPLSDSRSKAEEARKRYLKSKTANLQPSPKSLNAPDVKGIVDPSDGTLHRDALTQALEVRIPPWPILPDDPELGWEELQLEFSLTGADGSFKDIGPLEQYDAPILPGDFPILLSFPQRDIPVNGELWIRYKHIDYLGSESWSAAIKLICDSIPPWGEQVVPDPVQLPPGHINESYLASHPGGIEVILPPRADEQPGDTFKLYYLEKWPEEQSEFGTPVAEGPVPADRKVIISVEKVREKGDGRFFVTFFEFDKATNKSRMAYPGSVDVVLGDEPEDLQPPEVFLALDGILDLKDAQCGVTVDIREYKNRGMRDTIEVTWKSATSAGSVLRPEPVGSRPFPISVPVPPEVLRKEYGTSTGIEVTNVSYRILRGEVPYGPVDDDINVDFSYVGPERPEEDLEWPTPINPGLNAPEITSDSGQSNKLVRADAGKDATLSFALYERIELGHVVDFYWNGTLVEEATWVVDRVTGAPKVVTILWKYILAAGNNPRLPVHYTVRAEADALNEQESERQYVDADAVTITPDAGEFEGLTSKGWLGCSSLWDPDDSTAAPAFRIRIPASAQYNLVPGNEITLEWTVVEGLSGEVPIAVDKRETLTLNQEMIDDGFVWKIQPYADHILPIYAQSPLAARGRVKYSFPGKGLVSAPAENKVSIGDNGTGNTCDLTRP
ncbi:MULTISPECIES: hypothetical protein [unclassified Pseudomonas]|uniref:hypothetical protein n=1 Tax=unclassified Pseudomonas TaxID=196821 RepID=UPI00117A6C98|nr:MULTISPECIES: hypothetical protein [unclassified Pseudomonas]